MNIGLISVDSPYPNLALMKLAAYHRNIGDDVDWFNPMLSYDIVYMSKIFTFSPDYPYHINADVIKKGGTGYDLVTELPPEIDMLQPDYSLYPTIDNRTSYGFLTRGCPNHCKWCVVPRKEGGVRPYMDIDDITLHGKRPYAILMDNNILASHDWGLPQIEKIATMKYHIDFNQALDARLVTSEIAQLLARCKWIGSIVRFGCDTPKQIEECERAMELMHSFGYKGQWLMYCMLHGSIEECYDRLTHWRNSNFAKKVRVVAQPFRDPFGNSAPPHPNGSVTWPDGRCAESSTLSVISKTGAQERVLSAHNTSIPQWQRDMAHWATKHQIFATCDFRDFSPRKGFKCGQYFK